MQLLKKIMFYVFLIGSCDALAVEEKYMNVNNVEVYIKNYNSEKITQRQVNTLKTQIINNQMFLNNYINKLNINLTIIKNSNEISYSNGNMYDCRINLSYKNLEQPVLLNDMNTDILFTILHETAHCILTKDVMYKPLIWDSVSLKQQKKLQSLIDIQESNYLHNKAKVPPMLVYHEIFADTFASIVLQNYDSINYESNLNQLIMVRSQKLHDKEESHLSVDALQSVKKLKLKKHKLKIEEIYAISIKVSQASFIKYLENQHNLFKNNSLKGK